MKDARVSGQRRLNGASPVFLFAQTIGIAERDAGRFRIERVRAFRRPVGHVGAFFFFSDPRKRRRRLRIQRIGDDAIRLAGAEQIALMLRGVFQIAGIGRRRGVAPDLARRRILSARGDGQRGDDHERCGAARLHPTLFVRCTYASFNSDRCVCRKSSSSSVRLPAVFSWSNVRMSIICRAAPGSIFVCG